MLPSSRRLSVKQFDSVIREGKTLSTAYFTIRLLRTGGPCRFAAVAPQKVFKTAVSRNKIKRRIYEAVRQFYNTASGGFDIIFIAKKSVSDIDFDVFSKEVHGALSKSGLLK